jgi:alanine racemase
MKERVMTIQQLAEITNGQVIGDPNRQFSYLATDSRTLPGTDLVLFIAIRGEHHDGHLYIDELYRRGIRCFLVDREVDHQRISGASCCLVEHSMEALHRLAGERRKQFGGTVVSVTGSNGKTIVKEWLYQLLRTRQNVVRSPRSYNSQLGVPLSLWQLSGQYQTAIIEAGISQPGEMDRLERMVAPEIGILTNIGTAHSENFSSDVQKLGEKLRLFARSDKLIYRADASVNGKPMTSYLDHLPARKISWSLQGSAVYMYRILNRNAGSVEVGLTTPEASGPAGTVFHLPFTDDASIENLLHAITAARELGLGNEDAGRALAALEPVEMRLQTLRGIRNSTLVNDVYNSDLAGLGMALNVLEQQRNHHRKVVILSDVYQSGMPDDVLYAEVAAMLAFRQVDLVCGVGPGISGQQAFFPRGSMFFTHTAAFLEQFDPAWIEDAAVLIKGARKFRFEEITQYLQLQVHKTVLEININEMVHNLNHFRSLLQPSTRIMVMVKALAYGTGAHEVAGFLQHEQVDYLAVAFPDEGIRLRQAGVQLPVMVMNADEQDFRKMLEHHLEPELFSKEGMERFKKECMDLGLTRQPVHIKLDTGMHRLGFEQEDIAWLCDAVQSDHIRVRSLFTHLAGSDDPQLDDFTHGQVALFNELAARLRQHTGDDVLLHVLNTAGIERFPGYQMDMVRIGIGLYGQGISGALQPVSTFKTVISQLRKVKKGETVGYGRSGKVGSDAVIATIPVGYADGINRHLGNGNYSFYVQGKYAPTIGNICMDMTMLDITGIDATVGDTVELFGRNCPVAAMAAQLDTIVYEILTSIPERVKRVYIRE